MKKVIRNGKVAILISPGFGAGWSTWNNYTFKETLLFHPKLIEMVENGNRNNITERWMKKNLSLNNIYCGGTEQLKIEWLPIGTTFEISEYDGSECIRTNTDLFLEA